MKKLLFSLLFATITALAAQAQIVITEIMYNPPESGTDTLEYIELYNNTNSAVNVAGWNFTQGFVFVFPAGATIAAHQYVTIAKSTTFFQAKFGFPPTWEWDAGGALTNTGEDIELRDAAANVIDLVDYKNVSPWPTGAAGNGPSIVLCDVNADNNSAANWIDCTTATGIIYNNHEVFANPNAASQCPSGILANNDAYTVPSGETTGLNVTDNDYIIDPAAALVTVITAPQHGQATATPNNYVNYTSTANYCGPDAFTYSVCDQSGCDTATVNLTVVCYPLLTIDDVNNLNADGVADSDGITCTLEAITYGVNLRPTGLQFTMIDGNNNGIVPFRATGNVGYTVTEGDRIRVRGTIDQFNGLLQIAVDTIIKLSSGNPLVTPLVVINHAENTESKLIKINNLHLVDPAQWATGVGTGFSAYAVSSDHPQDTVQIRVDNDTDIFNAPAPTSNFNITGLGGQFDSSSPFNTGYQIQPRYVADLQLISGTQQVDFSHLVQINPNPVNEVLNIRTADDFTRIRIYNAQGILVQDIYSPDRLTAVITADWPAGLYVVVMEKNEGIWSAKVVK